MSLFAVTAMPGDALGCAKTVQRLLELQRLCCITRLAWRDAREVDRTSDVALEWMRMSSTQPLILPMRCFGSETLAKRSVASEITGCSVVALIKF